MTRLAYLIVGNSAEAEEVVQDAFADVWSRWDSILNPGGYLRTVVVRRAQRIRGQRRKLPLVGRGEVPETRFSDVHPSDSDHLIRALEKLSERQRTAVILAYWTDLGPRQVAEVMGISEGTAKSLVHRGIKKLRGVIAYV